ncbi:MAG: ABC transporter permease [Acidobacteria bacterium]|nr:ABC transporter permease [Acidobacteriota bacterium]MCB9396585.1 ABC transporter permease [Acidobacteriota bacterium]
MNSWGLMRFAIASLRAYKTRAGLSILGIAIGIASVTLLTALGEGARQYIMAQFTQFGSNIIAINPGSIKTMGMPGVLGGTTHHLTIEDAESLRRIPGVEEVVPVTFGSARVEFSGRGRSIYIYGVTAAMEQTWKFTVRQGQFIPPGDPRQGANVVILGPTLKRELFGESNPLNQNVRIGGVRFRVIGVMAPKGQMLGIDIDDSAYIPVAQALQLFNLPELNEIDLLFQNNLDPQLMADRIRQHLMQRHSGEEDFTITTQAEMLGVLDRIMKTVTAAVVAIGAISLLVGAIGILSLMWISVNERTAEIGLLKAIGAQRRQVVLIFFMEAATLSTIGGLTGLGFAALIGFLVDSFLPALPVKLPWVFVVLALVISVLIGIISGVLPAKRAAQLNPVDALHTE